METKFKVGDMVRCTTLDNPMYEQICDFNGIIVVGGVYTVSRVVKDDKIKVVGNTYYTPHICLFKPLGVLNKYDWL